MSNSNAHETTTATRFSIVEYDEYLAVYDRETCLILYGGSD